jgi:hypothetical protein
VERNLSVIVKIIMHFVTFWEVDFEYRLKPTVLVKGGGALATVK